VPYLEQGALIDVENATVDDVLRVVQPKADLLAAGQKRREQQQRTQQAQHISTVSLAQGVGAVQRACSTCSRQTLLLLLLMMRL
jgi:hypothetical protein